MFCLPFSIPAEGKVFAASRAVAGDSPSGCDCVSLLQLVVSGLLEGHSLSLCVLNCPVGQQLAKPCPAIPSRSCSSAAVEVTAALA